MRVINVNLWGDEPYFWRSREDRAVMLYVVNTIQNNNKENIPVRILMSFKERFQYNQS